MMLTPIKMLRIMKMMLTPIKMLRIMVFRTQSGVEYHNDDHIADSSTYVIKNAIHVQGNYAFIHRTFCDANIEAI